MAHAYRDDFPLLKNLDIAYLDNAATAQRPPVRAGRGSEVLSDS